MSMGIWRFRFFHFQQIKTIQKFVDRTRNVVPLRSKKKDQRAMLKMSVYLHY